MYPGVVCFVLPGMLLATMFVTLPFIVRELIPTLEQMDLAQEEAAKTLGANPLQVRGGLGFRVQTRRGFGGLQFMFSVRQDEAAKTLGANPLQVRRGDRLAGVWRAAKFL